FPRRKAAAELIEREVLCLPLIAPHLPLPIPVPLFAGRAEDGYPYRFAGYRFLPGATACTRPWGPAERSVNAGLLGRFLAALHSLPVEEAVRSRAPGDDLRKAEPAHRWPVARERLLALPRGTAQREALLELGERLTLTPLWN